MKILVDVQERRSSVPAHLESLGIEIELIVLPEGDYLIGPGRVVERKTVADLHRSIANGRLWRQVAARTTLDRSYLVVEGPNLDAGPITREGIRGAILQIVDNGISVVRSSGALDTAVWLRLLAVRTDRGGTDCGRRGRRRSIVSPVGMLVSVPGISPVLAQRLLVRFGSIAGVASATPAELETIEGVGPHRATSLRRVLLGTFPRSGEVP